MKNASEVSTFYPTFLAPVNNLNINKPDLFIIEQGQLVTKPKSNFVISRNNKGEVLSSYGDDTWNLKPYRQGGNQKEAVLNFGKLSQSTINDAKWLMFLLMFLIGSGKATSLGVSTLYSYMKPIRSLSNFAETKGIKLNDILSNETYMLAYVATISKHSPLRRFIYLVSNIYSIGSNRTGINVININHIDEVNKKLKELDDEEQTPVIPPRIYSELIRQLIQIIDIVNDSRNNIKELLGEILNSNQYARSGSQQADVGYNTSNYELSFIEASKQHDLSVLFNKFSVNNLPNLSLFISRVQHACRLLIATYTGMRAAESLSLMIGCLEKEFLDGNTVFRIRGKTTKLNGQEVITSWITSEQVKNAVSLSEMLADTIGRHIGLKEIETPLFISPGYLGFSSAVKIDENIRVSLTANKDQEVYQCLDQSKFMIQQEDFEHLKAVNEFRDWENDDEYGLNKIWRFKFHQLRRSLAFYVSQSALVGLPSLKRQLKHISREMTIYYCQSSNAIGSFSNDFMHLVKKIKPEADTFAFLNDVIQSDESLWGAYGRFIDKHMDSKDRLILFTENRKVLLKRFKNGEISYKTTPLGVCTKVGQCDQKAMREITACLSCDKAIIKLSKLDKVIISQAQLLKEIQEINEYSLGHKTEQNELENLEKYREKIRTQGCGK
jgi:hypothetical protein